ncbi:26S proteasome non-ATPase regulatory subunit 10 [Penicillium rolfsii]|nr:26S proteasome non-ATPase regulatory subunit 10 [Penicillium rolfsii]
MVAHGADLQIRAESAVITQLNLNRLKSENMLLARTSTKTRHTRNKNPKENVNFSACGETLLHRAATWNQEAVVRYLLDNRCDMLSIDGNGYYPIQKAARRGHESIVKLFLESGFHPNTLSWAITDPSPLHSALCGGHSRIVKLLLDYGADATLKRSSSDNDWSPIDLALHMNWPCPTQYSHIWRIAFGCDCVHGRLENCALLLIEHTAQLELFENNGYLLFAVKSNFVKVVQALLDLGIDPKTCLWGQTALRHAKSYRFKEIVDILEPLLARTPKLKPKRKMRKTAG